MKTVTVNGRDYRWPKAPVAVICCDGSEPAYMEVAMQAGLMPNLKRIIAKGENLRGHSVIPSFTNPNNLSIFTGRPPAVHGICCNYLIDPPTGDAAPARSGDALRVSYLALREMAAGLMYRLIDRE